MYALSPQAAARLNWRKGSYSGHSNCVEVADTGSGPAVRDTKNTGGPVLTFTTAGWLAFLDGARKGKFD